MPGLEIHAADVKCFDKSGKLMGTVAVYCDQKSKTVTNVIGTQSGRKTMSEWLGKTPQELATMLEGFPVPAKAEWVNGVHP